MRAFQPTAGGFHSALEPWERIVLEQLVREVAGILGPSSNQAKTSAQESSFPPAQLGDAVANAPQSDAAQCPEVVTQPPRPREGESLADARTLAALDFTPGEDAEAPTTYLAHPAEDPALAALLPQASEDPQLAADLAALIREPLRDDKHRRLVAMARELLAPSGPDGKVLVVARQLPDWLGALNDLRLFLAQRLEITTPQAAEAVHEELLETPPLSAIPQAHLRHMRVVLYEMVTWWQESLLAAVEEN
ncbi:Domain of uncharacterised function (DUF2017) [Actinomyces bovis]|uniref:Domain of uncharacterized function (DUF2017) n=1 Tax=Actinomyces bovis TaxID=1658 RepID=A0ABY1VP06_9ACTO|nr:DUF2017 family protein [Actinomyces bovis]SPT53850.1 Domain of uncharacterised function (DUF2017) [Actinomyces bovis]VEG53244.1 Domain of uncharacterised function (DUF2017) [Actinomyces israelii]